MFIHGTAWRKNLLNMFIEGLIIKDDLVVITGITAGILTATSMMPQVIKTIKTKKAENVSLLMLLTLISGVMLWIVYGCFKKDVPIICTNSFSLTVNIVMFFLRLKFGGNKSKGESLT